MRIDASIVFKEWLARSLAEKAQKDRQIRELRMKEEKDKEAKEK